MLRLSANSDFQLYSEKEFLRLLRRRWKGASGLKIERIIDRKA